MKPKEGTILTVARAAADRAAELADAAEDLDAFFDGIFQHAEETLARTPEMLPVLKEAGVVNFWIPSVIPLFWWLMMRLSRYTCTPIIRDRLLNAHSRMVSFPV